MQACDRIISALVAHTVVRVTRLAGSKQFVSPRFQVRWAGFKMEAEDYTGYWILLTPPSIKDSVPRHFGKIRLYTTDHITCLPHLPYF